MKLILLIALVMTSSTVRATEPTISLRDINAAGEYASKYFFSYYKRHGRAMRMRATLDACGLEKLAAQVRRDLPDAYTFAAEQFAGDPKSTPFDLSNVDMGLAIALATEHLVEGYTLGFVDARKNEVSSFPAMCDSAGKAYDDYLKDKTK